MGVGCDFASILTGQLLPSALAPELRCMIEKNRINDIFPLGWLQGASVPEKFASKRITVIAAVHKEARALASGGWRITFMGRFAPFLFARYGMSSLQLNR